MMKLNWYDEVFIDIIDKHKIGKAKKAEAKKNKQQTEKPS